MKYSLTVSTLPRCKEYKDHLRSKSSSGLGLGSSRIIEATDVVAFPSRCTIVRYVALRWENTHNPFHAALIWDIY